MPFEILFFVASGFKLLFLFLSKAEMAAIEFSLLPLVAIDELILFFLLLLLSSKPISSLYMLLHFWFSTMVRCFVGGRVSSVAFSVLSTELGGAFFGIVIVPGWTGLSSEFVRFS